MDEKQRFTLIENSGVQMDQSWVTEPMTEPGGDDTVISWRQQGYKQELHRRGLSRWITSLSKLSRMIMSVGERSQGMNQIGQEWEKQLVGEFLSGMDLTENYAKRTCFNNDLVLQYRFSLL